MMTKKKDAAKENKNMQISFDTGISIDRYTESQQKSIEQYP
jgi:hypothetical protein